MKGKPVLPQLSLKVFDDIVLKNKAYVDLILSDAFSHRTYYMGLVDGTNAPNFYDGMKCMEVLTRA
jgi:F420-non-reducing hydrogenase large subunit